jgi:hypothetical protein
LYLTKYSHQVKSIAYPQRQAFRWSLHIIHLQYNCLNIKKDSLADDEREGRPSFRESDAVKNEVRDVINGDRRLTVREVADKCGISKTTAHQILTYSFPVIWLFLPSLVEES